MNRRSFLSFVAALPFAGWGVAKAAPAFNLTATEVLKRDTATVWPTIGFQWEYIEISDCLIQNGYRPPSDWIEVRRDNDWCKTIYAKLVEPHELG